MYTTFVKNVTKYIVIVYEKILYVYCTQSKTYLHIPHPSPNTLYMDDKNTLFLHINNVYSCNIEQKKGTKAKFSNVLYLRIGILFTFAIQNNNNNSKL